MLGGTLNHKTMGMSSSADAYNTKQTQGSGGMKHLWVFVCGLVT